MRTFIQWFNDTFGDKGDDKYESHDRSWEEYITLVEALINHYDEGAWGQIVSTETIRGYIFWCWVEGRDYIEAVEALEHKFGEPLSLQ